MVYKCNLRVVATKFPKRKEIKEEIDELETVFSEVSVAGVLKNRCSQKFCNILVNFAKLLRTKFFYKTPLDPIS